MSVNSVNLGGVVEFDVNKTSSGNAQNVQSSATVSDAISSEDSMQEVDFSEDFDNDVQKLQEQHEQIIKQLQIQLESIRQQKHSLISQMALAQDSDSRMDISSQIDELTDESNSIYMDMVNQMQSYNASLTQLIAGTVQQQVEQTAALQAAQGTTVASSNVAAQTSLEGYNAEAGQKIAQSAHTVAGTTGWCLKGVNDSLERIYGARLSYNSAYQAIPELQSESGLGAHFREVSVSRDELSSLPAGAIVVWDKSPGYEHGHISIALGDGRESSDHITNQMTARDAEFHVFVPIS